MAVEGRAVDLENWRPPPWPEDFPQRLERLLEMTDMSRRDLAKFLRVTERTVQSGSREGGGPRGVATIPFYSCLVPCPAASI